MARDAAPQNPQLPATKRRVICTLFLSRMFRHSRPERKPLDQRHSPYSMEIGCCPETAGGPPPCRVRCIAYGQRGAAKELRAAVMAAWHGLELRSDVHALTCGEISSESSPRLLVASSQRFQARQSMQHKIGCCRRRDAFSGSTCMSVCIPTRQRQLANRGLQAPDPISKHSILPDNPALFAHNVAAFVPAPRHNRKCAHINISNAGVRLIGTAIRKAVTCLRAFLANTIM